MAGTHASPNKTKQLNIFLDLREILEGDIYELTTANGKYELYQKIEQIIDLETNFTQNRTNNNLRKLRCLQNLMEKKIIRTIRKCCKKSKKRRQEYGDQQGEGVRILAPNQMFSRLPNSLARLDAGNNSEKLKNETRQLLYSLYRSKK